VGMPRSGTTLVEQIIASHPRAFGAGELGDIGQIAQAMPRLLGLGGSYPGCLREASVAGMDAIAEKHLGRLGEMAPGALRVADKMPGNFQHLGLINLLFPGARVIHCTRHPMDTCFSIYATRLSPQHPYANDLEDIAFYYGQYRRIMAHWRTVVDLPMLEVRYEDLVANQEARTRELIAFLGLEWDEACLRFHETKRVVTTASVDQVKRAMYDTSIGRWKRYERHLGPLRAALERFVPGIDLS